MTATIPFGPFTLQWRSPNPNPPHPTPLPQGITRHTISTSPGPLELLRALPTQPPKTHHPPLLFAHGGFGSAAVWISYLTYFSERGYAAYAVSYRGHGGSWYPSFLRMYFTSRGQMAGDLVAGVETVQEMEGVGKGGVVLIAHSAGGGLAQWVVARGLVRVRGLGLVGAVPGFGSWSVYRFWAPTAPFHFPYRLFHPRYILATTQQVADAFFSPGTPVGVVRSLERILSPYESMLWPMQALFRFVTGPDVVCGIDWAGKKAAPRILVLAGEKDVICTPAILHDAVVRYRGAWRQCVEKKKLEGAEGGISDGEDGVRFRVVPGLGHHLQNHIEWERGADEVLAWVEML